MEFDPNNPVIKLCVQAMDMEAEGRPEEAGGLFLQAWNENDFEKFTAVFVAQHQNGSKQLCSLELKINNDSVKGAFPSLYLNIAKCHAIR